ncbi:MAG TPA: TIGR01777 family oxidoreductase [Vicinamibacterales bacterium]|nr:TIGR01777 family oxidoreductase [Vicinamibacterales bacterium]
MRVVIAGGSGFLGTALTARLAARGDEVVVLTRQPGPPATGGRVREVAWRADGSVEPELVPELESAGAVVNLAGAGIADRRWTAARKRLIRDSRLLSTGSLARSIQACRTPPPVFIQGSAVGFYGATLSDRIFDESHAAGDDFLGQLCLEWEREALPVADVGCRLVYVRTGLALAKHGGVLGPMKLPFLFFVGGPVASGRQYFPWVHRDDWVSLVLWAIDTPAVSGPVNGTAPNPVTNAEFSKALGREMGRPSWLPVPGFALRILVGEFADDGLLKGQRVVPKRTQELGFTFRHPDIGPALADVFRR